MVGGAVAGGGWWWWWWGEGSDEEVWDCDCESSWNMGWWRGVEAVDEGAVEEEDAMVGGREGKVASGYSGRLHKREEGQVMMGLEERAGSSEGMVVARGCGGRSMCDDVGSVGKQGSR